MAVWVVDLRRMAHDATVTTVPGGCVKSDDDSLKTKPGALRYARFSGTLFLAKARLTWESGLRITKVTPNAEGAVEVNLACKCSRFSDEINSPTTSPRSS
jgi:hypothetical protein